MAMAGAPFWFEFITYIRGGGTYVKKPTIALSTTIGEVISHFPDTI